MFFFNSNSCTKLHTKIIKVKNHVTQIKIYLNYIMITLTHLFDSHLLK